MSLPRTVRVRTNQIYISPVLRPAFADDLMVNHGLVPYHTQDAPAIFYGLMSEEDIRVVLSHKSWKIIIWVGGDVNHRFVVGPRSNHLKARIRAVHASGMVRNIAISQFIVDDLRALNVPYLHVPFMGSKYDSFEPVPKGPCIYLYTDLFSEENYGRDYYLRLMEDYPHITFIVTCCRVIHDRYMATHEELPYPGMRTYEKKELVEDVYPRCFVGLRLTTHDGLSGTVQELGMMGIKSIHNGCSPSALNYDSYEDIKAHIDRELLGIGQTDHDLSRRVKEYLKIDEDFFMVDVENSSVGSSSLDPPKKVPDLREHAPLPKIVEHKSHEDFVRPTESPGYMQTLDIVQHSQCADLVLPIEEPDRTPIPDIAEPERGENLVLPDEGLDPSIPSPHPFLQMRSLHWSDRFESRTLDSGEKMCRLVSLNRMVRKPWRARSVASYFAPDPQEDST